MRKHGYTLGVALFFVSLVLCYKGNASIRIFDGSVGGRGHVGGDFVNRFKVPTEKEAAAKVQRFRDLNRPITLKEFLGADIDFIRITFFDSSRHVDFKAASAVLQSKLDSTIIFPTNRYSVPNPSCLWAEGTQISIAALIHYKDGHDGRIEIDGWHLFFQDNDGTFWWHRQSVGTGK